MRRWLSLWFLSSQGVSQDKFNGGGISDKKGIGCPWSLMYPLKDMPCLLPQIRVSVMVANLNLLETYFDKLPFYSSSILALIHIFGLGPSLKVWPYRSRFAVKFTPPPSPHHNNISKIINFNFELRN